MVAHGETARMGPEPRVLIPAAAPGALPERLQGIRVLAVDDEEDAVGLLRVILESAGAEVTTADPVSARSICCPRSHYDAIIADIGMPRMDGLELIRRIRQTLPAPANRIPAAALTAYARSEDRVSALASGFDMHIAKPVNPTELVIAVAVLVAPLTRTSDLRLAVTSTDTTRTAS